jgi:hypothetical protein
MKFLSEDLNHNLRSNYLLMQISGPCGICDNMSILNNGMMMIIWHAYIWTLWHMRNNKVFNNGIIDADEAVEAVKRLSWQWFIGRMAQAPCLFYEWRWNPGVCFYRWWRLQFGARVGWLYGARVACYLLCCLRFWLLEPLFGDSLGVFDCRITPLYCYFAATSSAVKMGQPIGPAH